MITITTDGGVVTLLVVFSTTPDKQSELVRMLDSVAQTHSRHDGFVSCTLHRSLDGARVAEYIQWRSITHLQAMLATPGALAHTQDAEVLSDGRPYEVVSVTEAPTVESDARRQ